MTNLRYRFGRHALDLAKRELQLDGTPVPLPARVFECVAHLIEHRDRAIDRDELARAVFSRSDVSDAQLAQIILRSRRAIGDDGHEQRAIRTIPRFGYRWTADVVVEQVAAMDAPLPAPSPVPANLPGIEDVKRPLADTVEIEPAASPRVLAPVIAPLAHKRRRIVWITGIVVIACIAIAALAWRLPSTAGTAPATSAAATATQRAIMVLPMRVEGPRDAAWARLGLMDYLIDRMRRAGLPALGSDTTLNLLRQAADAKTTPDPNQLRRSARVNWIVESEANAEGDAWSVRLRASDPNGLVQRGSAQGSDLLETTRIAGDRLLAALGGTVAPGDEPEPGLAERLQRAQAAMLANELDTARRILNAAPELQRAQPQLRYRLAQVDFRAGQYARGLASLDALLAGASARDDPMFRARLLNSRGAVLIRLDRYAEAERSYDDAIALLERTGSPVELGHAFNGRGVTRSSQGRFDAALDDLGRARVQLLRSGDALAVARVDANLGNVEMDRERPAQAVGYFRKATRDFESMGAVNELAGIGGMLAVAELQLLQPKAALAESDRMWALLPRIRDPAQRANVIMGRAEALLAVGRLSDAGRLLAMPETATVVPGDYKRREFLGIELVRRGDDPALVVRLADAALADWPADRRPRLRAWTQWRRERAAQGLDLPKPRDAVGGDGVPERLLRASRSATAGNAAAADASYRAALELAGERAIPEEIAEAVEAYADWLLSRGEADRAGGLSGRVAPWSDQDFDLAVLQVAIYARMGQREPWAAALQRAQSLAGERAIPAEWLLPPANADRSNAITP